MREVIRSLIRHRRAFAAWLKWPGYMRATAARDTNI